MFWRRTEKKTAVNQWGFFELVNRNTNKIKQKNKPIQNLTTQNKSKIFIYCIAKGNKIIEKCKTTIKH